MSTSPPRFYASRRNSKDASRPTSPPDRNAEVRSQAVAMLKRAASLPRNSAGRRPPPLITDNVAAAAGIDLAGSHGPRSPAELQEVLSPSPTNEGFGHAALYDNYASPPPSAFLMQRSASAASSYHMPTPPGMGAFASNMSSPYFGAHPATHTPDWAAMHLAQTYLPSLSPAGIHQPAFPPPGSQSGAIGRNTPSPLPTLGELRTLQRSNSAMARAHAMNKLTGGSSGGTNTPADEDDESQGETRTRLQRSGTVGAHRLVERVSPTAQVEQEKETPDETFALPRPRLQRSFTVSSSNMGEERRSAVGRRMVARLGERRAARQKEEEEVRQLWEERRAAAEQSHHADVGARGDDRLLDGNRGLHLEGPDDHDPQERIEVPTMNRISPAGSPRAPPMQESTSEGALGVPFEPERPISGTTMRSEAFEFDSNLRRSLSSRTARDNMGTVNESMPPGLATALSTLVGGGEDMEEEMQEHQGYYEAIGAPLGLPRPAFATPSRHTPHGSTSTESTIQGSQSPGESIMSRDPLGSMMFVMGGSATAAASERSGEYWPSEVEEHNGSDWGTPARDSHQPIFPSESPVTRSPLIRTDSQAVSPASQHLSPLASHRQSPDTSQGELTPPGASQRTSVMSWEEVGGAEDQAVPTDPQYHHKRKKPGSISAKVGRNIRTVMRNRSHSSSVSSSTDIPPTSPKRLSVTVQNFSRRGSQSSNSPSQNSASRSGARHSPSVPQSDFVRHQPSMSSLSPSLAGQTESSANSMLLQHQLQVESPLLQLVSRADLHDPRIHSEKLSPFPGIAQLGKKGTGDAAPGDKPRLIQQTSDSAVPSQHRVAAEVPAGESIYSLPLPLQSPGGSRRASDDSVGKRSWLAKAFGQATSPRSSGANTVSRHNSTTDVPSIVASRKSSVDGSPQSEADPFAGPPAPPPKMGRHRSASPSVSVVPEVSEEGSRLTRFTAHTRLDNASPAIPEVDSHAKELPPKTKEILNRMDDLLSLGPDDPARPDILDDPPRKLLLATQVLQVVNVHTAKDRFLFLFNDLLVVTKPLITQGHTATLDMKFLVKSIVSLDKIQVSGFEEEPTVEPPRHAVVQKFIRHFAEDPKAACQFLVERSNPKVDSSTLASLIFKTPELDRTQVGILLASNDQLMRAFIDRFHFSGIRIDDALRMFLLAVRLPSDAMAAEALLRGFAHRYFEANRDVISFSRELAEDLVLWIMQLNDTLYGMYGFALPNPAINLDVVIAAFQSKDPHHLVHLSLLSDIYTSLEQARIDPALTSDQERKYGRKVTMTPSRLPSKLTYNVWSDPVAIAIPERDDRFMIRLLGEGLEFDPPVLDFGAGREQSFRYKGMSLGTKSILFDRTGANAALYASIGNSRTVSVERAFMRHTFHVAFTSHTGLKRRYCFSVSDATTRAKWAAHLQRQITRTAASKRVQPVSDREKIRHAAEVVSLQVLRDALIPAEDTDKDAIGGKPTGRPDRPQRAGSVSVAYAAEQGRAEVDLGPLVPGRPGQRTVGNDGMAEVKNGKELVLLCRQNSLLPGVLELLQAGMPGGGRGSESDVLRSGHGRANDGSGVGGGGVRGGVERAGSRRGVRL